MKKICSLIILILFFIIGFDVKLSHAIFFKQGEYLEKNQWGALEDILNDWQAKKITTDECALYGCYVLAVNEPSRKDRDEKIKLLPSRYRLDKKSKLSGPYFFVNFLYKFENKLSPDALNEFRNSDWSDFEYYDKFTKNEKIVEIINKIEFETSDNDKRFKDVFKIINIALKEKILDTEEAIILVYDFIYYKKRTLINLNSFFKSHQLLIGHITVRTIFELFNGLCEYINTNHSKTKVINIINYYSFDKYTINKDESGDYIYDNGFLIKGGILQEREMYLRLFKTYYQKICVDNRFKIPVNFLFDRTLEITLAKKNLVGSFGETVVQPNLALLQTAEIILYLDNINDPQKYYLPVKAVIHELFHAIQYSYNDTAEDVLKQNYHWFTINHNHNPNPYAVETISESTAVWAQDYFSVNSDSSFSVSLKRSHIYFFNDMENKNYSFPAYGLGNAEKMGYYFGFFWNYFYRLYGDDSVKKLWELIEHKKPLMALTELTIDKKQNILKVLHNFGINNFLVTKQAGIYPDEYAFKNSPQIWPLIKNIVPFTINDDHLKWFLPSENISIEIPPFGTQIIKIRPSTGQDCFKNNVTMDFESESDSFEISVISKWKNIDNISNTDMGYLTTNLISNNKKANYKYFTKKGLNPEYFIILATTDNQDSSTEIKLSVKLTNPEIIPPSSNVSQIINNGSNDYVINVIELYKNQFLNKLIEKQNLIKELYKQYKNVNYSSAAEKEYIAIQICQNLKDMNLLMQTTINQIHDLRYQYYLYKNICINRILNLPDSIPEPTPPLPTIIKSERVLKHNNQNLLEINVIPQLTNLKNFMTEMTKLYNPKDEKTFIYAFNAFIIKSHAFLKISEIKNTFNWTDEENAINDEIEKMYKKFNSIVTGKNYPFWYTKEEMNESINVGPIVGMLDDEVYNPTVPSLPKTPGPVNFCPNVRTEIIKSLKLKPNDEIFTVSPEILNLEIIIDGQTIKGSSLLCLPETVKGKCDPISLRYFSSFKKHAYHENNMPPGVSPVNIKDYVSAIAYYMKVGTGYSLNNFDENIITKKEIIKACSDRINELMLEITSSISKESKDNTGQLYNIFKESALKTEFKDEMLDMLEKQISKDGLMKLNFNEK